MVHANQDGQTSQVVPGQPAPSREEAPPRIEGPLRPSLRRTPPGVMPPVTPAGIRRMVRRVAASALGLGQEEPLLAAAQGAAR
jgi:hypothetical protein